MATKRLMPMGEIDTSKISFGIFLRVARNSMGLNQADMAAKLGIARGTLCDIEKGRQLVSTKLAAKVARKAGLSEVVAIQACLQDQVNKARLNLKVSVRVA
jgi:DNA-binding XRE family transcriptional regulator